MVGVKHIMSIPTTGSAAFDTEELMDVFLSGITPCSTVMIKEPGLCTEYENSWEVRWCPGKNITKHFDEGANGGEDIYWYTHDKLWQLIPAFG